MLRFKNDLPESEGATCIQAITAVHKRFTGTDQNVTACHGTD